MAVATHAAVQVPLSDGPRVGTAEVPSFKAHSIETVNDLIEKNVATYSQSLYLGYPQTPRGKGDYVFHTFQQINDYVNATAWSYAEAGLVAEHPSPSQAEVVAILAPSNLEYVVSVFALSRMGFAVLFLSNRLAREAYVNLLQETKCTKIVASPVYTSIVQDIQSVYNISAFGIQEQAHFTQKQVAPFPVQSFPNASRRIAFIVHSSGSTGLPKPIFQTHRACVSNYSGGIPYRAFLTLPLFHNHGISTLMRALCSGKQMAMYNSNLPLSGSTLIEAMEATQPESLNCVPYALKLLAESSEGIAALQKCKLVLYGGSSCPDDLGDLLVNNGIYLVGHYGATEMGQLMTSFRDPADKAWNYMRPLATTKEYLKMEPSGNGSYECVVLDGLPSKVLSNSDDPPNSYHTKDTFLPHPTIPDAWKYLGRLDDRVTLVNGEKVLPIPYEHHIRHNELVEEVVVFGVGKAIPGLIIIPSQRAAGIEKDDLLQRLLPDIEAANAKAEAFGRIVPEMVRILDIGTSYPKTDKGTVIRARFYREFSSLIDEIYANFEAPIAQDGDAELLTLERPELVEYLLELFKNKLGFSDLSPATDFFEAGVDSLQAISARAQITRQLDLGGKAAGQNVVFEYPSVDALADHLLALRTNTLSEQVSEEEVMMKLIEKFSDFASRVPGSIEPDGETLLLTGTTGSLGVHMLSQVVQIPHVRKVYCLVRASSPEKAEERVLSTLQSKGLPHFSATEHAKLAFLPSDLSQATLGLSEEILEELRTSLTAVIHSAWAVNFNLGVRSFESHHIKGAYNLINTCLGTKTVKPARFFFCSSISAAAGTPLPARITETYIKSPAHAQPMGYARSKFVTEHIIRVAGEKTGMTAEVLRLGQIIGDTENGVWNLTEAIPLMIRSAQVFGALPALDETPSWMPVDRMAKGCLELAGLAENTSSSQAHDSSVVFQVQNNKLFHWTRDLLPALKSAGLDFKIVSQREWVALLRDSEPDPAKNPTIKLIDFFAGKYDNDKPGREGLVFETQITEQASESVKSGFDVIGSGLIKKMVSWWQSQW
ncbi:hypothetical protein SUNI508_08277 [Seiridium unicorne]|uniref:Carrier domain-containing protein n=1 Tax=Seiridium unicorne TaxID=138068 RepID=A0ABR2UVL5_9PEZI